MFITILLKRQQEAVEHKQDSDRRQVPAIGLYGYDLDNRGVDPTRRLLLVHSISKVTASLPVSAVEYCCPTSINWTELAR